jgi:hypothetical protein
VTTIALVIVAPPAMLAGQTEELREMIADWEALDTALQLGVISRVGWDKMKSILARAVCEAADDLKGLSGYVRLLQRWERCEAYDGRP